MRRTASGSSGGMLGMAGAWRHRGGKQCRLPCCCTPAAVPHRCRQAQFSMCLFRHTTLWLSSHHKVPVLSSSPSDLNALLLLAPCCLGRPGLAVPAQVLLPTALSGPVRLGNRFCLAWK